MSKNILFNYIRMSNNYTSNTSILGGDKNIPLKLFQPFNIIVWLSFYSPMIIATCITGLSFVFQNFKGLIYLGYLIGFCVVRNYIYFLAGSMPINTSEYNICNSIQYSTYGNPTFSAFVFAFTITYLAYPMFINNSVNLWVLISMITYGVVDMLIKLYKKCIIKTSDLIINILLGIGSASLIVSLMYAGGSGKYLFFNEVSSDKEVCSQPSKQTFKCNVYKNGELVGEL